MRFGVVGNLVAHAWPEQERAAILELRVQLTFQAEQDVAFGAPVIRDVARAVVHPPDPDRTEVAGAPSGHPSLAAVARRFDQGPVSGAEGDARHFHKGLHWRRVRDSNPRTLARLQFSRLAPSTTRPTLRASILKRGPAPRQEALCPPALTANLEGLGEMPEWPIGLAC